MKRLGAIVSAAVAAAMVASSAWAHSITLPTQYVSMPSSVFRSQMASVSGELGNILRVAQSAYGHASGSLTMVNENTVRLTITATASAGGRTETVTVTGLIVNQGGGSSGGGDGGGSGFAGSAVGVGSPASVAVAQGNQVFRSMIFQRATPARFVNRSGKSITQGCFPVQRRKTTSPFSRISPTRYTATPAEQGTTLTETPNLITADGTVPVGGAGITVGAPDTPPPPTPVEKVYEDPDKIVIVKKEVIYKDGTKVVTTETTETTPPPGGTVLDATAAGVDANAGQIAGTVGTGVGAGATPSSGQGAGMPPILTPASALGYINIWEIGNVNGVSIGGNGGASKQVGEGTLSFTIPAMISAPEGGDPTLAMGLDVSYARGLCDGKVSVGGHANIIGYLTTYEGVDGALESEFDTSYALGPFGSYFYQISDRVGASLGCLLEVMGGGGDTSVSLDPGLNVGYGISDTMALNGYVIMFNNLSGDVADDSFMQIGTDISFLIARGDMSVGVKTTTGITDYSSVELYFGGQWRY